MKKTMLTAALITAMLTTAMLTTGCASDGTADNTKNDTTAVDESSTDFDSAAFIEEITPNVEYLNSCLDEIFVTSPDFGTRYTAAYASEEAYDNGNGTPAILFLREDYEKVAKEYFIDPTLSDYYPVSGYTTNAEVRENLEKYMSKDLVDKVFHDDFMEFEGKLYLVRGSKGYGAYSLDMNSLKYDKEIDGKQYATVDMLYFSEYDKTLNLELEKQGDNWIMDTDTDLFS